MRFLEIKLIEQFIGDSLRPFKKEGGICSENLLIAEMHIMNT